MKPGSEGEFEIGARNAIQTVQTECRGTMQSWIA